MTLVGSVSKGKLHSDMHNCKVNFSDLHEEMKPCCTEGVPRNTRRFSMPLEILKKNELIAYAHTLENLVDRLQQKDNYWESDWQRSYTSNLHKIARKPGGFTQSIKVTNKGKENKKFICRYFSSGYCRFGDACWFAHQEIEKPLKKAQSSPSTRNHNFPDPRLKCSKDLSGESHCSSEGANAIIRRVFEYEQLIPEIVDVELKTDNAKTQVVPKEAAVKTDNSSTVETSEGHKNSESNESRECSSPRENAKRSKRKRKAEQIRNRNKNKEMNINWMSQTESVCKEPPNPGTGTEMGDAFEAETNNVEAVKSSESSTIKSLQVSGHNKPLKSSEEPHKEVFASKENVDKNFEILKTQEKKEKSCQEDDVSTHTPAKGPVNIRSFDEESWLLGRIETENDPYWFENKCFRQLCTTAGGVVLKKFIAKFKEIKNAERTKDHSSIEEEEKKYGLTSP